MFPVELNDLCKNIENHLITSSLKNYKQFLHIIQHFYTQLFSLKKLKISINIQLMKGQKQ